MLLIMSGLIVLAIVQWDIFQTMVLPRMLAGTIRITHHFYKFSWRIVRSLVVRLNAGRLREALLATFGPFSLLALIALWAGLLIFGFGLIQTGVEMLQRPALPRRGFGDDLYFSGTTFFTLGLGDERPLTGLAKFVTVAEAGFGFGILAVVVGYLPVLYQSFSRREIEITLLIAHSGTPPTAAGYLGRCGGYRDLEALFERIRKYEEWCAELLENHTSYPMLAFYRSQHDGQSWLSAVVVLLDTCALLQLGVDGDGRWVGPIQDQAELTFDMGCRLLSTLCRITHTEPVPSPPDRLSREEFEAMRRHLADAGLSVAEAPDAYERLTEFRKRYEPYSYALSLLLVFRIPPFIAITPAQSGHLAGGAAKRASLL